MGVTALLTAGLGFTYNAISLAAAFAGAFNGMSAGVRAPYFAGAFFVMSAICICCYLGIVVCAVDLLRLRLRTGRLLVFILLFEIGYFFAVGSMWNEPTVGASVAAATGVANGGMMAQYIILFPIWGPVALWAAGLLKPSIGRNPGRSDTAD